MRIKKLDKILYLLVRKKSLMKIILRDTGTCMKNVNTVPTVY